MRTFYEYKHIVNDHLGDRLPDIQPEADILRQAMEYSLRVGGKRLRPVLLLAACEFARGDINEALPYALCIEYIHTYSLIHDDLPAMDNDDLRRGKPTNHKVYGEDMAILAGDALLSSAAEALTAEPLKYTGEPEKMIRHLKAANEILKRAGACGMIAGQVADVRSEYEDDDGSAVRFIEEHKTADLITAPVRAGLIIAGASDIVLKDFTKYAFNLGIAFQVLDDILDFEGDAKLIGKNTGKDKDLGKCNYVCVHGMEAAKKELHALTNEAVSAVERYGMPAAFFLQLAEEMEIRKY